MMFCNTAGPVFWRLSSPYSKRSLVRVSSFADEPAPSTGVLGSMRVGVFSYNNARTQSSEIELEMRRFEKAISYVKLGGLHG